MSNTLLNKNQVGDGIWTADNLVAGSGISIQQVQQPLIDEDTVSLFHFDETVKDEISGDNANVSSYHSFVDGKFGKAMQMDPTREAYVQITPSFKLTDGNYTLDYWAKAPTGRTSVILEFASSIGSTSDYNYFIQLSSNTGIFVGMQLSGTGSPFENSDLSAISSIYNFFHVAYVVDKDNLKVYLFLNGTKVMENTLTAAYIGGNAKYLFRANGIVDEVRLSNTVRWTSDFTPFTVPYSASAGPAQYAINNTKADPDLSGYLQNKATGTDSLTIDGTATTGTKSVNIGKNSTALSNGVSIGYSAKCTSGSQGTSIGTSSQTYANGTAVGFSAVVSAPGSTSIGSYTTASGNYSIAIGGLSGSYSDIQTKATAQKAIVIGINSQATAESAIQLGSGTNNTANTFQVFNTTVVDASGKVPMSSTDVTSLTGYDATKTQVLKNVNGTLTWVDEA